ncbi:MAG: hypothetical protein Q7K11_00710 [Candidatus Berkelbacteria bacterium]|nr:hypothetical protein [Candidatus Berkelbacteria bacterium]
MGLESKPQNEAEKEREFKKEIADIFRTAGEALAEAFLKGWRVRTVENQEPK